MVLASLSANEIILNRDNSDERQRAAIFVVLFIMPNTVEQASEFVRETRKCAHSYEDLGTYSLRTVLSEILRV